MRGAMLIAVCAAGTAAGKDAILVARGRGEQFDLAAKGLREELGNDFSIKDFAVAFAANAKKLAAAIETVKPKAIVLMDNRAIKLYCKVQQHTPDASQCIPSVCLMAAMVETAMSGLKNSVAISYEVPIVTSAVSLRALSSKPIEKIGVIHRTFMTKFITKNTAFCRREKFELVSVSLPDRKFSYWRTLRNALDRMLKGGAVDALWIPNDNKLLTPELIRDVWAPIIRKHRVPAIVSVEVLVHPRVDMGSFAVLPDHRALGAQAAELIFEARDNNWRFDEKRVECPISVYKGVNGRHMKEFLNIEKDALGSVDRVFEK
jgi:hypothetical protein